MPVLYFLIILGCFLLWLLGMTIYQPLGKFIKDKIKEFKRIINEDDDGLL